VINLEDRVTPSGEGPNIVEAWKLMGPDGPQILNNPDRRSGDISGEEIT
jgi:hypothetical protein